MTGVNAPDLREGKHPLIMTTRVMGEPARETTETRRKAMLEIDPSKVCFIIAKAHAFDAQEGVVEEDDGSNPSDDDFRAVLEAHADDPTYEELCGAIRQLNWEEQCQLVALAWMGRGDYTKDEWKEAVKIAQERHSEHTAEYLAGMPLLGTHLEDALEQFGISCGD